MRHSRKSIAVTTILFLSVAFILFAVSYSPQPPPQGPPPADTYGCLDSSYPPWAFIHNASGVMRQASLCYAYQDQLNAWSYDYSSVVFWVSFWKQASVEIAEGLAVISALACLSLIRWPIPEPLRRARNPLRGFSKRFAQLVVLLGLGFYAFATSMDIAWVGFWSALGISLIPYFMNNLLPVGAGIGLLAASLGLGLLKWKEGLWSAFQWSVLLAALSIVIFQAGLVAFDLHEMTLYITGFSSGWIVFGFPAISNWFALTVSIFLLGWATLMKRQVHWD